MFDVYTKGHRYKIGMMKARVRSKSLTRLFND